MNEKNMQPMTITQQILAGGAGLDYVEAGQFVEVSVDLVFGNDITAPLAINEFARLGADTVFDKNKIAIIPDHFTPNKDIKSAENSLACRNFARLHGLAHHYEIGRMGIEHCLIPELGLAGPGQIIVGADSHTCTHGALGAFATGVGSTDMACAMATGKVWLKVPPAIKIVLKGKPPEWVCGKDIILNIIGTLGVDGALYKSIEFYGDAFNYLTMDDRFTICNMVVEAGAKNGLLPIDETAAEYLAETAPDARIPKFSPVGENSYERELAFDVSGMKPTVSLPHVPSNIQAVDKIGVVEIDQVVIGSCTNGRLGDLRIAAAILAGRKGVRVARGVQVLIIPGSQKIYLDALREGLIEDFILAGAAVGTPTCGPCIGGHMGVLAKGERALATTNRNFRGRMGHADSEVFLAGPAVAAATAVAGRIAGPGEIAECAKGRGES